MTQILKDKNLNKLDSNNIYESLVNCSNTILTQILLELYNERSGKIKAIDVLRRYGEKLEFFGPSDISLRKKIQYDNLFLESLPSNYTDVDLSLINPLGTNSVISSLSQNSIMTTTRASEVISDPTTALSLEASNRRRLLMQNEKTIYDEVNLATISKVLRMQPFEKAKGYMQHFDLFGLVSSGRKQKNIDFNVAKIYEQIDIWLNLITNLKINNFSFEEIEVGITNIQFIEQLIKYGHINRAEVNANSLNDNYNMFLSHSIDLPSKVNSYNEFTHESREKYKLYYQQINFSIITECIIEKLKKKYPNVIFYIDLNRKAGLGYYNDICFHIYAVNQENVVQLSDGGVVNWNSLLLSDNKEQSVTSGFGAELTLKLYGKNF